MSEDDRTITRLALGSAILMTIGYPLCALLIAKEEPRRILATIILLSVFCSLPLILIILGSWLWQRILNQRKGVAQKEQSDGGQSDDNY